MNVQVNSLLRAAGMLVMNVRDDIGARHSRAACFSPGAGASNVITEFMYNVVLKICVTRDLCRLVTENATPIKGDCVVRYAEQFAIRDWVL